MGYPAGKDKPESFAPKASESGETGEVKVWTLWTCVIEGCGGEMLNVRDIPTPDCPRCGTPEMEPWGDFLPAEELAAERELVETTADRAEAAEKEAEALRAEFAKAAGFAYEAQVTLARVREWAEEQKRGQEAQAATGPDASDMDELLSLLDQQEES